jgi:hypothetical protein
VRVSGECDLDGSFKDLLAAAVRCSVTVLRQSTTVPKTSVRRALGGLERDMGASTEIETGLDMMEMVGR